MSRVALIGDNSIEYVNTLLDIWNAGDCAVLIDWRIPFETTVQMMREAGADTCYIEKRLFDKVSRVFPKDITFVQFENRNSSAELLPDYIFDKFRIDYSRDEAVVLYSSGTTGKAKGIILSHFAINTNADAIIDYLKLEVTDCMYMIKTISHSSSITGELLVALKTRTKILISPIIVPPRYTLNNIQKYSVTKICINPTLLRMYIDECQRNIYQLSSLKEIYVHGAKASMALCRLSRDFFKNTVVYFEYGLSEAGPRVASQKLSRLNSNSVGKAINGVEIAIIDEHGDIAQSGNQGIIHINTPSRSTGYVSGVEKYTSLYKDWLNTGDMGYTDGDGELHILDRIDDVIMIDAHKVYPSEVEKQILQHTEATECVVTSFDVKNERIIGCLYTGKKEIQNFKRNLMQILMPYEVPRFFFKCDIIPRTVNGKISKAQIKEIFQNAFKLEER